MPNGGSDCCGTCWFNSEIVRGKHPFQQRDPATIVRCVIRDEEIKVPFWTYCANHPHHNPERIELPIGPIYADAGEGFPYRRKVLVESPDTQEIRFQLLSLLVDIEETPQDEYPTATQLDETVIYQLGEFREGRAVSELRRILAFDPLASSSGEKLSGRDRIPTVACAIVALSKIVADDALPEIRRCIALGSDAARQQSEYSFNKDPLAGIRYEAVKSLAYVSKESAHDLLATATNDPNPDVAEAARGLLRN